MSHLGRHDCQMPPLSAPGEPNARAAVARWLPRDPIDPRSPMTPAALIEDATALARAADDAIASLRVLLQALDPAARVDALAAVARHAPAVLRIVMPHYGRFAVSEVGASL